MRRQTATEEIANAITHGAGVLLSLACGSGLVVLAALTGSAWKVATSRRMGPALRRPPLSAPATSPG